MKEIKFKKCFYVSTDMIQEGIGFELEYEEPTFGKLYEFEKHTSAIAKFFSQDIQIYPIIKLHWCWETLCYTKEEAETKQQELKEEKIKYLSEKRKDINKEIKKLKLN